MIQQHKNCIQLDISLNCIDLFSYFSHLPHAALLDSASKEHENSRFDIITIAPIMWLEVKNNLTYIDNKVTDQNCFDVIQQQLDQLDKRKAAHGLPFSGGWLG